MSDSDKLSHPANLVDALRWLADHRGDEEAYTFLVDGEAEEESLSFGELDRRARAIGAQLRSLGEVGERALLLCPAGLDYVASFFGCLYAGFVAVPAYAPDPTQHVETLRSVVRSCQPLIGITTRLALPAIQQAFAGDPELARLPWLCVDEIPTGSERDWREPDIGPDDLVCILCTSGSTAIPKGVIYAYRHFPLKPLEEASDGEQKPRFVTWGAPHAIGGIIGTCLGPLTDDVVVTFMAPEAFSERPARWIAAMSRTRAIYSGAPNFAYDLLVEAIPPEERSQYDLSGWQLAFNGGEQVRPETIESFEDAFAGSRFRPESICAMYGLTEVRSLTIGRPGGPPTILAFDRARLEEGMVVCLDDRGSDGVRARVTASDERGLRLVGQGPPNPSLDVVVVDPTSCTRCAPERVGEIWASGTSISSGYWNDPEGTRHAFQARLDTGEGPYFRTGDLGFFYEGELFLAGRKKEMIIIRGRNIYPLDVEIAVQTSHPALQSRAGAAFAVEDGAEERLAVVQEVEESANLPAVATAIRRTVAAEIGAQAYVVALVPPGSIPRTSTGKIRHAACREAFLAGELPLLLTGTRGEGISERLVPYVPPMTQLESDIAAAWELVLGISPIGIHDDFLDLGGDSLRSLQTLARMREQGIHATLEQIYRHGTIAALARAIASQPAAASEEGPIVGPVPMLLMQYAVLGGQEQPLDDALIGGSFLTVEPLDPEMLDTAAKQVVFHHDALRLRFAFTSHGWEARCVAHVPNRIVSYTDLSTASAEERETRILAEQERLRSQVDISRGLMLQIGLLHLGPDLPDRLIVFVSHLAVDAVCFPILMRDLETAYLQLRTGKPVSLPARTTSIRTWGEKIRELAASDELRAEIPYWLDVFDVEPAAIPPDFPVGDDAAGAIHAVWRRLGVQPTQHLLRASPRLHGFQIGDAILYAVARAVSDSTGLRSVLIDTLVHGREPLAPDMDLSRTLGYFTSHVPVRLDLDPSARPAESAASVRAHMERIPRHGLGFDILRYLCNDPLCRWLGRRNRLIEVNYAGVSDGTYDGLTLLLADSAPPGDGSQPSPRVEHIRIRGMIIDDCLYLGIEYHDRVYMRATAEQLIASVLEHLEEVADASPSPTQLVPAER